MLSDLSLPPNLIGHLYGYININFYNINISNTANSNDNDIDVQYICFKLWGADQINMIDIVTQKLSIPEKEIQITFPIRTKIELFRKYLKDCNSIEFYLFKRDTNVLVLKEGNLENYMGKSILKLDELRESNIWYERRVEIIDDKKEKNKILGYMNIRIDYNNELPSININKELSYRDDIKKEEKPILIEKNNEIIDKSKKLDGNINKSNMSTTVSDIIERAKKLKNDINNSLKNENKKDILIENKDINNIPIQNNIINQDGNSLKIIESNISSSRKEVLSNNDTLSNNELISNKDQLTEIKFEILSIEFDISAFNQFKLKGKNILNISCTGKYGLPILQDDELLKAKYHNAFSTSVKEFKRNTGKSVIFENVSSYSCESIVVSSKVGALVNLSLNIKTNFFEPSIQCFSFCLNNLSSSSIYVKGGSKPIGTINFKFNQKMPNFDPKNSTVFLSAEIENKVGSDSSKISPQHTNLSSFKQIINAPILKKEFDNARPDEIILHSNSSLKYLNISSTKAIQVNSNDNSEKINLHSIFFGDCLKFSLNLELNLSNFKNYYISVKPFPNSARINESLTISYSHILTSEVLKYLANSPLIIEIWKMIGKSANRLCDELLGLARIPINSIWNTSPFTIAEPIILFNGAVPITNSITGEIGYLFCFWKLQAFKFEYEEILKDSTAFLEKVDDNKAINTSIPSSTTESFNKLSPVDTFTNNSSSKEYSDALNPSVHTTPFFSEVPKSPYSSSNSLPSNNNFLNFKTNLGYLNIVFGSTIFSSISDRLLQFNCYIKNSGNRKVFNDDPISVIGSPNTNLNFVFKLPLFEPLTDLKCISQCALIIEVYDKNDSLLIGHALVRLSPLCLGINPIYGWYNIISGNINTGQINVTVNTSDDFLNLKRFMPPPIKNNHDGVFEIKKELRQNAKTKENLSNCIIQNDEHITKEHLEAVENKIVDTIQSLEIVENNAAETVHHLENVENKVDEALPNIGSSDSKSPKSIANSKNSISDDINESKPVFIQDKAEQIDNKSLVVEETVCSELNDTTQSYAEDVVKNILHCILENVESNSKLVFPILCIETNKRVESLSLPLAVDQLEEAGSEVLILDTKEEFQVSKLLESNIQSFLPSLLIDKKDIPVSNSFLHPFSDIEINSLPTLDDLKTKMIELELSQQRFLRAMTEKIPENKSLLNSNSDLEFKDVIEPVSNIASLNLVQSKISEVFYVSSFPEAPIAQFETNSNDHDVKNSFSNVIVSDYVESVAPPINEINPASLALNDSHNPTVLEIDSNSSITVSNFINEAISHVELVAQSHNILKEPCALILDKQLFTKGSENQQIEHLSPKIPSPMAKNHSKTFLNILKHDNLDSYKTGNDECKLLDSSNLIQLPLKVLITINDVDKPCQISNFTLPLIPNSISYTRDHITSNLTQSILVNSNSGDSLPAKSEIDRFNRIARIMGIN